MIGVIDIGNTFFHCCYGIKENIIKREDFKDIEQIKEFFKDIEEIIVISNSEEKREKIKDVIQKKKIIRFPAEKIERDYEGRVGEDRISSSFYLKVKGIYPAIIIDAGTAITIDFINDKGIFSGGGILPGIKLFFESYKMIETLKPSTLNLSVRENIGKRTDECIYYGINVYINGIKEIVKKYGIENVFLTGGDAEYFEEEGWKIDKEIVLKGGLFAYSYLIT
uniref:Type III pantothenate kinase n=1 Tax=candidate division WOR-3 bacterium TaxID=2052148 RepID=A0A7C4YC91_UNCW3